jgi:2-phospho-L-lactate guanylyltransferase
MTAVAALLPIRNRVDGKRRLATVFTPAERRTLIEAMAQHVVSTLLDSGFVSRVMVISQDPDFVDDVLPDSRDVALIHQRGPGGLNAALELGREWALVHGASRVLTIFGDLPLLGTDDLRDLVGRPAPIVIGPDSVGQGTNALLLDSRRAPDADPVGRFRFRFGRGSLASHQAEAARLGVGADLVLRPGTGQDLDTPEDWNALPSTVRRRLLSGDPCVERSVAYLDRSPLSLAGIEHR